VTQDDRQVLDLLARSPEGMTEQLLHVQGIACGILERLSFAGYVRQGADLFSRSRGAAGTRFYLTPAGHKARDQARIPNVAAAGQ
jgi:hypothetical protein